MPVPTMKDLLESGVHFGHQTRKWNPKMKPYIFQERNGIYIIDLLKTIEYVKLAYEKIKEISRQGGTFLFVGTKKQASKATEEAAKKCGMYYVSNRWLGGMLTNFSTVKKSIARLKRIERMEVDGTFDSIVKKERVQLIKEKERLNKNLAGIKDMETTPDMIFIIDPVQEAITVNEAKKMRIPIVAIIDTNCDPDVIDIPIPGNDDAIRAINLFANVVADAIIEGQNEAGKEDLSQAMQEEEEQKQEQEIVASEGEKENLGAAMMGSNKGSESPKKEEAKTEAKAETPTESAEEKPEASKESETASEKKEEASE